MKYSFVLIAYNEENNIINCIRSIENQQGLGSDYEILVVDDGSRDKTVELVSRYSQTNKKVRLISDGKNHGRGFGRHRGVEASKGEYVIMVDADIVLPVDWLETALPHMTDHDVAGGIAVPDGDVAYIFRRFKLKPKTVMGSTTITGNNGIYKRKVFAQANFDPNLREGEDVDFNHSLSKTPFTAICISGLTVEHQEHKSFPTSMQWLYQSGIGATRQLLRFKQVRLPDIAFFMTFAALLCAIAASIFFGAYWTFVLPLFGAVGASLLHMRGKFYLSARWPFRSLAAVATDTILIACYYVGRAVGFIVYARGHTQDKT